MRRIAAQHIIAAHQNRFLGCLPANSSTGRLTIRVGAAASSSKQFSLQDVLAYNSLMGNDVPLSTANAQTSAAAAAVEPPAVDAGMLIGLVSRVLGTQLPGPQSVYARQITEFMGSPDDGSGSTITSGTGPATGVRAGDIVTATVTVRAFVAKRGLVHLDTRLTRSPRGSDADDVLIATGEVIGVNKNLSFEGEGNWK